MERLVTTSEAAKILGISLQGVHYRIKSGQLKSLKQSGKTFVYVTEFLKQSPQEESSSPSSPQESIHVNYIVEAKDEQISLLKQSIGFIKEQYKSEIKRLEKNQKRIIHVFNSEIKLLQSAFNEMRSIYKPQIESKAQSTSAEKKEQYISINEFTLYLKEHNKSDQDIKIIILNCVKRKDHRFIYNKITKKVLIQNSDFSDLI
ncbi:MAG: helix-turn-helix domain-containing protein [Candidatus Marinarcus sp.]|uniref:helix-turn-helix domain-containing protein n=1 Tax=Candidatus Marinarcus sp. TaxID=3100987 RepID=UPI003B000B4D